MGKLSVHQQMNGRRRWISFMTREVKCQLCPPLCDPMDCSPPDSSVHGIFQVRILEWVAISFFRGSSQPKDRTWLSCTAGRSFTDLGYSIIKRMEFCHLQQHGWTRRVLSLMKQRQILYVVTPIWNLIKCCITRRKQTYRQQTSGYHSREVGRGKRFRGKNYVSTGDKGI